MKMQRIAVFTAAMAVAGFASAGDNKTTAEKVQMLDTDGDGRVSAAEYTAKDGKTQADFARLDTDGDGYAGVAEMEAHRMAQHQERGQTEGQVERAQGGVDEMTPEPATAIPPTDDN